MIDKLMRVEKLGSGDPELTVVGSIHGDEPCGKKAIERFLNSKPDLKKPVKFIIANQKALEKEKRFLEGDLNRAFSGDTRSSKHEGKRYYSSSESKYFQKTEKLRETGVSGRRTLKKWKRERFTLKRIMVKI